MSRQRIVDILGILVPCGVLLMALVSETVSVGTLLGLEIVLLALSVLRGSFSFAASRRRRGAPTGCALRTAPGSGAGIF